MMQSNFMEKRSRLVLVNMNYYGMATVDKRRIVLLFHSELFLGTWLIPTFQAYRSYTCLWTTSWMSNCLVNTKCPLRETMCYLGRKVFLCQTRNKNKQLTQKTLRPCEDNAGTSLMSLLGPSARNVAWQKMLSCKWKRSAAVHKCTFFTNSRL